jgi:hypothetical protein
MMISKNEYISVRSKEGGKREVEKKLKQEEYKE